MLDTVDFIKKIETDYDVKSITASGIQVWPFMRNDYFANYNNKYVVKEKIKRESRLGLFKRFNRIFYGLWNLANKYDYIVLSEILELRDIQGRPVNRVINGLYSKLNKDSILLMENPVNGSYYKRSYSDSINVLSSSYLILIAQIFKFKSNLEGEDILKRINKEFDLDIDYGKSIGQFFCYHRLFRMLFKLKKPRAIFLTNYYNAYNQAAIYTAKQFDIRTIEFQHGLINKKDSNYNVFADLDPSFFPDYLLTFGNSEKGTFDESNHFIDVNNVWPIGSFYIDLILKNDGLSDNQNNMIKKLRKKYDKIVVVSSQWTIEEKLIEFINKAAALDRSILYIFMPRNNNVKNYLNIGFEKNVMMIEDVNLYQICKYSDFHLTVYSSFALEAPALGTPNILINLDGLASKHLGDILTNDRTTRFVQTDKECNELIKSWQPDTKDNIMNSHRDFFEQDHMEKLHDAIKKLGLK